MSFLLSRGRLRLLVLLLAAFVTCPAWAQGDEIDKADTAWVMISTALVLFMTLPGLALFYGGLVRVRNVLSVLMQCMVAAGLVGVLWVVVGFSIAFGGEGVFWGDFSNVMLKQFVEFLR